MSLNTDIWNTTIPGTDRVTIAPQVRVKVTVDGEDLGTAAEVVVNSQIFGEGNPSVDLKGLAGLADVSFYGHVYRDLRKANKELEWERDSLDDANQDLREQVAELTTRRASDDHDARYWHLNYRTASKLYAEYAEKERELTAEVERLKQSRKEQAEKHNKKQANLQANFEQRTAGKVRNTKLQRELESSQSYNEHLKLCVQEKDAELVEVKSKLDTAVENAKYLAERSDNLESRLRDVKAASAIWHEKFLADADAQLDIAVSKYDYLVDSVNGISDIVNDAANRQGFDLG